MNYNLETPSPSIISRESVIQPLTTGTQIVDTLFPLGRGQRQLLIGDQSTGKTSLAVTMVLNQKQNNRSYSIDRKGERRLFIVYVSIGNKKSEVAQIVRTLRLHNAAWYTTIVYAWSSDSCALQYIAPFSGAAIGEYFRNQGLNSLVILDDLSKHAVSFQQLSLLMKKAPSRKAYPGDISYLHARLLERAAQMNRKFGYGTMSMIPIIETQQENFSAYIPTNVISITDGQIYLGRSLYLKGLVPAVDIPKSVSRIGSKAQSKLLTYSSSEIRNIYFNFFNIEDSMKAGQQLNSMQLIQFKRGQAALSGWLQDEHSPRNMAVQVLTNLLISTDLLCAKNPKSSLNFILEKIYTNTPWLVHFLNKIIYKNKINNPEKNFILTSIIKAVKSKI